jgi:hypothetical protein
VTTHSDHSGVSVFVFALASRAKLLLLAFDLLRPFREDHGIAIAEGKR